MRFLRKWLSFLRLCIGSCGWNYLTVRNLPHLPSQVLKPFGVNNCKNYVFHDLVFQDMNTSEHDCQDLAATTDLKSYIFLSRLGNIPSFEMLHVTPCPQVLTMTALFKTWLSKSWNFWGKRISTLDPCQELCLSWLGLPRHEHIWKYFSRLGRPSSEIFIFSRLGITSFEMLHVFATPCRQVLTMIALFKTWLSKSWTFSG